MIVSMLPTMAFAEAGVQDSGIVTSASGLCEHHTQHDESCSYTEGTAEIPCSHEHDESCGGLTDPEACNHTHDEACGYVPATEGTPCTYVCEDFAMHRTAGTQRLRPTHNRKNVPVKPSAPRKKSMGIVRSALRRVPSWTRFASVQLCC